MGKLSLMKKIKTSQGLHDVMDYIVIYACFMCLRSLCHLPASNGRNACSIKIAVYQSLLRLHHDLLETTG